MTTRTLHLGVSWGGLLTGPLAWAISTQLNYALVPWECSHHVALIPFAALLLALLAAAGGALSWRACGAGGAAFKPAREERTERFVATLGIMAASLFGLVIVMQGAASLILGSCTR